MDDKEEEGRELIKIVRRLAEAEEREKDSDKENDNDNDNDKEKNQNPDHNNKPKQISNLKDYKQNFHFYVINNQRFPYVSEAEVKERYKSMVKQSPFDRLQRHQYKYKSHDGRYYILAYHEGDDEDTYTFWSKYLHGTDELVRVKEYENQKLRNGSYKIPTKEFYAMLNRQKTLTSW